MFFKCKEVIFLFVQKKLDKLTVYPSNNNNPSVNWIVDCILQKAKEKGFIEFTNLDVTAFLVYKMYIALIIEWSDKDKTMDEQMIANSISEIIKRGLRKEWFLLWKKKKF